MSTQISLPLGWDDEDQKTYVGKSIEYFRKGSAAILCPYCNERPFFAGSWCSTKECYENAREAWLKEFRERMEV